MRTPPCRRGRLVAATLITATSMLLAGCDYKGLNDFTLPGAAGTGDGSYQVTIEMNDVGDLVPNNPVRIGDVDVGTITDIELEGWHALVTISLPPDVRVPADSTARIGQVSLLGAKFMELAPPARQTPAERTLGPGARLSLAQSGKYPETEEVLASVAALLNGGGLQQLRTISTELGKATNGRTEQYRSLLAQLDTFVSGIDDQKADITRAIDGLDRLSARLSEQNSTIDNALTTIPPALKVLNDQRAKLTNTLTSLGDFGVAADDVIQRTQDDLAANISNLDPSLKGLADAGKSLTDSLGLLGTLVFPLKGFDQIFRGDYINFWLTLDLTLSTLDRNFLTNTPFAGSLANFEKVMAAGGGTATQMTDPLLAPVRPAPDGSPAPVPVPEVAGDLLPEGGGEGSAPATAPTDPPSAPGQNEEPRPPGPAPEPEPGGLDGIIDGVTGGR